MLKVSMYFCHGNKSNATYLQGVSKRLSALGFQPVVHDRFKLGELSKEDQQLICNACGSQVDTVEVGGREFSFGIKFSELSIYLVAAGKEENKIGGVFDSRQLFERDPVNANF